MGTLIDYRTDLAGTIAADSPDVPDQIELPAVIVQPGDPYLDPSTDPTFATVDWRMRLEVFILVDPSSDKRADDLDTMLTRVLAALPDSGWGLDTIGQPQPWETADWLAFGIQIKISRYITIDTPGD